MAFMERLCATLSNNGGHRRILHQLSWHSLPKYSDVILEESPTTGPEVLHGSNVEANESALFLSQGQRAPDVQDPNPSTNHSAITTSEPSSQSQITEMSQKTTLKEQRSNSENETVKQRRLLESQDSSYDSDYENSESLSPRVEQHHLLPPHDPSGSSHLSLEHIDVSRTVSDTLGAEFAEYITHPPDFSRCGPTTLVQPEKHHMVVLKSPRDEIQDLDLDKLLSDPAYTSRVEFGVRLGYTERQVQMSLNKLGSQAPQNELLAELIRLGTKGNNKSDLHVDCANRCYQDGGRSYEVQDQSEYGLDVRKDQGEADNGAHNLRHVVIDGSNVAMSHGNKEVFSCRGIRLCVDWFRARGHQEITVFVPIWRKEASRPDAPINDQDLLLQLERERFLVFTPSRHVGGRRLTCYDDRYILRLAADVDGVVVSNDNYRDLLNEAPEFKKVVEERLLMYSFVNDRFMPPDDPLGRHGPSLDNFLRKQMKLPDSLPPPCPYGKKCTYGNKCKYYHPERGSLPQKSVTERLAEQAKIQLQEVKARGLHQGEKMKAQLPLQVTTSCDISQKPKKVPLSRTKSLANPTLPMSLASDMTIPSISTQDTSGQSWSALDNPEGMSSSNWVNMSLKSPHNIPGSRAELFLEPESGGHLSVAKRLSDPDNGSKNSGIGQFSGRGSAPGPNLGNDPGNASNSRNLHRKLQRQLTLNPNYDPRLVHMHGYVDQQAGGSRMNDQPQNVPMMAPQSHKQHVPLSRIVSDSRILQANTAQMPPHHLGWDGKQTIQHQHVARIASAPDSTRHWSSPSPVRSPVERMKRLSSTSDTRLNMTHPQGSINKGTLQPPFYPGAATNFQPWIHPAVYSGAAAGQPTNYFHENFLSLVLGGPPNTHPHMMPHLGQPVRPSSVPPPGVMSGGSGSPLSASSSPLATPRALSPDLNQDTTRRKIMFRLSNIFPEEQVQIVMDTYPDETDPQRLCAAILAMFPKDAAR